MARGSRRWRLEQLRESQCKELPETAGVYMIVQPKGFRRRFVKRGTGGRFKRKDPNVNLKTLQSHWVSGANELYIGKADNLRKRVRSMLKFGSRKPVAHWGGRLIWQLRNSWDLLLCWAEHPTPEIEEARRLDKFSKTHGQLLPFANLRR